MPRHGNVTTRRRFGAAWAIGAGLLLVGCGVAPTPTSGTVSVQLVRADNLFIGSHQEVRIVAADGTVVGGSEVPFDTPATIAAPVGAWTIEALTVFISDAGQCILDPAASGGQRCLFPNEGPQSFCRMPIVVAADRTATVRLTILESGCRLESLDPAGPASDEPGAT
jgi:hypothetical protein